MPTTENKNLHVPLPGPLYDRLRMASKRSQRPATEIAREAIDRWLDEQQKKYLHQAIAEYARSAAGTSQDLDPELEAAGVEFLLSQRDDWS